MRDLAPFVFPEITDEDIAWACQVMGLPDGAFDQNRKDALKAQTSIDVAACPGSGKTTLLVAKLAILARKWTDTRRGICVLSHTNVARNEIEQRLGSTAEGQALLRYPHFIGTIHGFVDWFLGIPYLRWKSWDAQVDDDLCFQKIEEKIQFIANYNQAFKNQYRALSHSNSEKFFKLKLVYSEGGVAVTPECSDGNLDRFPNDTTLNNVLAFQKKLKLDVSKDGYHAFDDMFVYGHRLLDVFPGARSQLIERFPVLFIDEAQDNSELQSNILHRVFVDGETDVVCQRFGDANQAIFHSVNSKDVPTTWVFPSEDIKCNIPDSHRFGQAIANFAAPLAVEPQDLTGSGPDQRKVGVDVDGQHTIFLFDEGARARVLPAFAEHLREVFSLEALEKGSFVAVGGKHKKPKDDETHRPNSVCDYWQDYAPEQTKADPRPDTFVGYLQVGRAKLDRDENGNLHHMVESIASGVLEAVRRAGGQVVRRQRKDRHIREVLAENKEILASYNEFLRRFAVNGTELTRQVWDDEWQRKIGQVAEAVFEGEVAYQAPLEFFNWPDAWAALVDAKAGTIYQKDEQLPKIRLGSIHSVKGETHTGVLVLETFIRSYLMRAIKRWLLGNTGTQKQIKKESAKLKLHYVAVTRPTHLLCLALPVGTFQEDEVITLSGRGWRIGRIDAAGAVAWEEMEEDA